MPDIACTLSGVELPRRLAEIRALGRDALLSIERHDARAVLRFRPTPAARSELERIVAAESRCCAFLDLEVTDGTGALNLTIAAPAGAEPVMSELVDAFAVDSGRSEPH